MKYEAPELMALSPGVPGVVAIHMVDGATVGGKAKTYAL